MTRPISPQDNPNNILGCHPCIQLGDQTVVTEDDLAESVFPASRRASVSFLDGLIVWKRRRSRRRKCLDGLLLRVEQAQVPGSEHVLEYLRLQYRRNCKPRTISCTATSLVMFLLLLKSANKLHLELITRRDIEAFVEHEQDRGMQISTVRLRLHNIYGFLRYLRSIQMVPADILERKIHLKIPCPLPRAIPPEDTARLLSVIDDVRDRAMILMLLRTGMRIGELRHLHVNDVDLAERTVKIYQGEKNSVGRVVYLSEDACDAVSEWMRQRNPNKSYLFYGHNGPLGYTACRLRMQHLMEKAGLADKGYTLHSLRHTFATDLLNAGMRLESLQQLLGHSNIEVTRIYAKLSDASRMREYFTAMAKIERGNTDAPYGLDH